MPILHYPIIIGTLLFKLWTTAAWLILPPQWQGYVADYVHTVELVDSDSRFNGTTGVYTSTCINAGSERTLDQLKWYACSMVHEARHGEQLELLPNNPFWYWGIYGEIDAIRPQRQCLVDLNADPGQIEWLDYLVGEYSGGRIDPSEPHDY